MGHTASAKIQMGTESDTINTAYLSSRHIVSPDIILFSVRQEHDITWISPVKIVRFKADLAL